MVFWSRRPRRGTNTPIVWRPGGSAMRPDGHICPVSTPSTKMRRPAVRQCTRMAAAPCRGSLAATTGWAGASPSAGGFPDEGSGDGGGGGTGAGAGDGAGGGDRNGDGADGAGDGEGNGDGD